MILTPARCLAAFAAPILAALAACASPPVQEVPAAPEAVETPPAVEQPMAEVTLTPQGDRLLAEWSLPAPVTMFRFNDEDMSVPERAAEWRVDPDTFDFNGLELSRKDGATFDTFSASVLPAQAFYDRFYVPVVRIGGQGWNIYGWAFTPQDEDVRIRFAGLPDGAIVYAHGDKVPPQSGIAASQSRMIYFGPASNLKQGAASIVAGDDVPGWLRQMLDTEINESAARLGERFGTAPDEPPVLIITYSPDGDGYSFKGGVTGRFISIHLRGMDITPDDSETLGHLKNTALHESSHAWLGHMYRSTENSTQSWVEEGAAEYIANRLWMSPEEFRDAANDALGQCRSLLGSASLWDTGTASRGRAPYKCGVLVELIAEAAAKQRGTGDILDIWRAVFEASGDDRTYNTDEFLAVVGEFGGEAFTSRIAQLRAGLSPEGWQAFTKGLAEIGIGTTAFGPGAETPDNGRLSVETLKALLLDTCAGGYGIRGGDGFYAIEMGDRCPAPLSADPDLSGVNGISLTDASGAAYSEVRRACAAGEPLVFTQPDGTDLPPLACGDRLKALPDVVQVDTLPDFAPL